VTPTLPPISKWTVSPITRDSLTDEATATALLIADSGTSPLGDPVTLAIRCAEGDIRLSFDWGESINAAGQPVVMRFGTEEAEDYAWTFHPGSSTSEPFISSMLGRTQLIARTTAHGESPVTAVFSIAGVDKALWSVREACSGW